MITGCYDYTQIISLPRVYYYSEFLFLIVNVLAGEEKLYVICRFSGFNIDLAKE